MQFNRALKTLLYRNYAKTKSISVISILLLAAGHLNRDRECYIFEKSLITGIFFIPL